MRTLPTPVQSLRDAGTTAPLNGSITRILHAARPMRKEKLLTRNRASPPLAGPRTLSRVRPSDHRRHRPGRAKRQQARQEGHGRRLRTPGPSRTLCLCKSSWSELCGWPCLSQSQSPDINWFAVPLAYILAYIRCIGRGTCLPCEHGTQ